MTDIESEGTYPLQGAITLIVIAPLRRSSLGAIPPSMHRLLILPESTGSAVGATLTKQGELTRSLTLQWLRRWGKCGGFV